MVEVSAAVICRGGQVLICQRPRGKNFELLWEFPGGKVEPHESPEACIVRECREELGIAIRVIRKLSEVVYKYPKGAIRLHFFAAEIVSGELVQNEHVAMAWITPDELHRYTFCPPDRMMLSSVDMERVLRGGEA